MVYCRVGSSAFSSSRRFSTAWAAAISLAPDCLDTCSITQPVSPTLAMEVESSSSRATEATSDRRTVPPAGRAMMVLATSSTDWNLASVETVSFWVPFCRSPPG